MSEPKEEPRRQPNGYTTRRLTSAEHRELTKTHIPWDEPDTLV